MLSGVNSVHGNLLYGSQLVLWPGDAVYVDFVILSQYPHINILYHSNWSSCSPPLQVMSTEPH